MHKRMGALGGVALGLIAFAAFASTGCGSSNDAAPASDSTGPASATPTGGETGGGSSSSSGGNSSGGTNGGSDGAETPAPTPEQPRCPAYTETLPTNASLTGLSFSRDTAKDYLLGALGLRYPVGKANVEGGMTGNSTMGNCLDAFLTNKTSADAVLRGASTTVHECGHYFDLGQSKGATSTYVIRPDLKLSCESGDTTSRGGKTFARSEITKDAYASKRTPCGGGAKGCDSYGTTYLTGQSGAQGYNSVLEEASQYVNSLATALAFQEQYAGSHASERDGILTFLWYIERYLAMARVDHPDAYQLISEDACWRKATLTIWDRGWFYLDATKDKDTLGLDDAAIEALVKDPALTAEIDALRKLECGE